MTDSASYARNRPLPSLSKEEPSPPVAAVAGKTYGQIVAGEFLKNRLAVAAAAVIAFLFLVAVLAPFLANGRPYCIVIKGSVTRVGGEVVHYPAEGQTVYPLLAALTRNELVVLLAAATALAASATIYRIGRRPPWRDDFERYLTVRRRILAGSVTMFVMGAAAIWTFRTDINDPSEWYRELIAQGRAESPVWAPVPFGYADTDPARSYRPPLPGVAYALIPEVTRGLGRTRFPPEVIEAFSLTVATARLEREEAVQLASQRVGPQVWSRHQSAFELVLTDFVAGRAEQKLPSRFAPAELRRHLLEKSRVSATVLTRLEPLAERRFASRADFDAALRQTLSPQEYAAYAAEIIEAADTRGHQLGTDRSGGDVLARLIYGSRTSLAVGFVAVGISVLIGVFVGSLMGYFGGWVDTLLMRVMEIVMAIPTLILIITIVAVFPRNLFTIMAVIGVTTWPTVARFIRAEFLRLRQQDFVSAARALGASDAAIVFRHMLPNGLAPVLVDATFGVGSAIFIESTLSFLGLGAGPDAPSWGGMLSESFSDSGLFLWWMSVLPGAAIFITVLCYNLVGEGLRDAIDPRLRKAAS